MTQRLKVVIAVRATAATRYDVIHIGSRDHLVGVDGKGIDTKGVGTKIHGPLLAPACTVPARRCGLSHIIRAQSLRMTQRAYVTACLDYTNASTITTWMRCSTGHELPHQPATQGCALNAGRANFSTLPLQIDLETLNKSAQRDDSEGHPGLSEDGESL